MLRLDTPTAQRVALATAKLQDVMHLAFTLPPGESSFKLGEGSRLSPPRALEPDPPAHRGRPVFMRRFLLGLRRFAAGDLGGGGCGQG
jgi:hypothetical protein